MSPAIQRMEQMLERCQYLDCYRLGVDSFGEQLAAWPGIEGQRLAIPLANRLGGWQLSRVLAYRLTRLYPDTPEAAYYRLYRAVDTKPLAQTWLTYHEQEFESELLRLNAGWEQLKAGIVVKFRDFESAHRLLDRAAEIHPESQSVYLNRVSVLLQEDRIDDALELCMKIQRSFPLSSPVASAFAAVLTQANQVEDAIDVLESNLPHSQLGAVAMQLVALHTQRKQYDRSVDLLRGIEKFFPLADPLRLGLPKPGSAHAEIAAERSEVLYHLGKLRLCIKEARRACRPYYDRLADHLEEFDGEAGRKELKVPFQRQDHMTCAPATLSMLAGYWEVAVDHDQIANEICYEGTSAVDQRLWAEANGFVAREFRCTEEATQQLIDHDIPFALTTVEADSAHIQVVCGYDRQRGTILIQDPGSWYVAQGQLAQILEAYGWSGPRALVLVPKERADVLQELDLPELEQYEWLYHLEVALRAHNRNLAQRMLERLQKWDASHRLTHWGTWLMAGQESSASQRLAALTALCEMYPKSEALLVRMADELIRLGKTNHSIGILRDRVAKREAGLTSYLQLISLLGDDCSEELQSLLSKVLLWAPTCEQGLLREALRLEQSGEFENGFELLRLASCVSPSSSTVMGRLLYSSERFGKANEVIAILRKRFEELGHLSSDPGLLLARALEANLQHDEAIQVVRAALQKRPNDGELVCEAAVLLGLLVDVAEGRQLLEQAQTPLPETSRCQALAQLAQADGKLEEALKLYNQAILAGADECLYAEAVTQLTAEVEGVPATIRYLSGMVERHPENSLVLSQTASWMIHVGELEKGVALLDRVLSADSSHGWAWRERALVHLQWNQPEQALEDANKALQCEQNVYSYQIRGDVLVALGRLEEAKSDYQAGLERCIDSAHAIRRWVSICRSDAERLQVVRFVMKQLATQNINGEGLRTFYDEGRWILDSEAMEQSLLFLRQRWPNRLEVLTLYSEFLQSQRRFSEAIEVLTAEEARFGKLAEYWSELGVGLLEANRLDDSIAAYREAFQINPNSVEVAQRLVYALNRAERSEDARQIMERALASNPNDARLLLGLAELAESDEKMVQLASQAAFNAPRWDAPWQLLEDIDMRAGTTLVLDVASELIRRNARDAAAYVRRAEGLRSEAEFDEGLAALDKAIELEPSYVAAHQAKANRLAFGGNLEAALEACQPEGLAPQDELELCCYAAELLYQFEKFEEACEHLYETIRNDTSVLGHWSRLADMAEEIEDFDLFATAADVLYDQAPESEVTLGYRFAKFRNAGEIEEAEECLREAIAKRPGYEYGVYNLFLLLADQARWEDANELIECSRDHVDACLIWEASLQAAVSQGQLESAEHILREVESDQEHFGALLRCCHRWEEERKRQLLELTEAELKLGRASAMMAKAWGLLTLQVHGPRKLLESVKAMKKSKAWFEAVSLSLEATEGQDLSELEDGKEIQDALVALISKRIDDLSRHAESWSGAIWSALRVSRYDLALKLAKTHSRVPDVDSQALTAGLAAAVLRIELPLAGKIVAFARENKLEGHPDFIAFSVIHFALKNDFEQVTRLLMKLDRHAVQPGCQPMLELVVLALEAQDSGDLGALNQFWLSNFEQPQNYEATLYHALCRQIALRHRQTFQVLKSDFQRLQLWWQRS